MSESGKNHSVFGRLPFEMQIHMTNNGIPGSNHSLQFLIDLIQLSGGVSPYADIKRVHKSTDGVRYHLFEQGLSRIIVHGSSPQAVKLGQEAIVISLEEPVEPQNSQIIHFPFLGDLNYFKYTEDVLSSHSNSQAQFRLLNRLSSFISPVTEILILEDILNVEMGNIKQRSKVIERDSESQNRAIGRFIDNFVNTLLKNASDEQIIHWSRTILQLALRAPNELRKGGEEEEIEYPGIRNSILRLFHKSLSNLAFDKIKTAELAAETILESFIALNPDTLDEEILRFIGSSLNNNISYRYLQRFFDSPQENDQLAAVGIIFTEDTILKLLSLQRENPKCHLQLNEMIGHLIKSKHQRVRLYVISNLSLWREVDEDFADKLTIDLLENTQSPDELKAALNSIYAVIDNLSDGIEIRNDSDVTPDLRTYIHRIRPYITKILVEHPGIPSEEFVQALRNIMEIVK